MISGYGGPVPLHACGQASDADERWNRGARETAAHLAGLSAECALKSMLIGLGIVAVGPDGHIKKLFIHIDKLFGGVRGAAAGSQRGGLFRYRLARRCSSRTARRPATTACSSPEATSACTCWCGARAIFPRSIRRTSSRTSRKKPRSLSITGRSDSPRQLRSARSARYSTRPTLLSASLGRGRPSPQGQAPRQGQRGLVRERRRALEWLIRSPDRAWDDLPLAT